MKRETLSRRGVEVGQIFVGVDEDGVAKLLEPDREALTGLIQKRWPDAG